MASDFKLTSNTTKKPLDFIWSLKPIVLLLKIFGTKIDALASSDIGICFKIYGFILLCNIYYICLHSACVIFTKIHSDAVLFSEKYPSDLHWKYFLSSQIQLAIEIICYSFLHIINPSVFFCSTLSSKWQNLWNILNQIHAEFPLSDLFHRKVRRTCYSGLILWVVVSINK